MKTFFTALLLLPYLALCQAPSISVVANQSTICQGGSAQLTATVNAQTTQPLNSQEGNRPITCDCPAGYVAVGYRAATGEVIDNLSLACKKLNAGGSLDPTVVYTNSGGNSSATAGDPALFEGNTALVGINLFKIDLSTYYGRAVIGITGYGQPTGTIEAGGSNSTESIALREIRGGYDRAYTSNTGTLYVPNGHVITGITVVSTSASNAVGSVALRYAPIIGLSMSVRWSTNQVGPSIAVSPLNTTTYTATAYNFFGASSPASITVGVNAIPAAPGVADVTKCQNSTPASLSAISVSGATLTWYSTSSGGIGSANAPTISTSNPGQTTYYVSQTLNGCESNRSPIVVTINPLPTPAITGLSNSYCKDATAVTLTGNPGNGAFTVDGQSATQLNPANLTVGSHTVRYTVTVNGCTAFAEQSVEIKALPNAGFSGLASAYCANTPAVTLTPNTAGGTFLGPGVLGTTFTPGSGGTVSYSLTVNGCTNTSSQNMVVNPLPQATLGNNGPLSANQPQVTLTAGGGSTYTFTNGVSQTNPPSGNTASVTSPGVYQVTVTSNGCTATASATVTGATSQSTCRGGTATITVVASGSPAKYEWYKNSPSGVRLTEVAQLQRGTTTASLTLLSAQTTTDYYVRVTDQNGSSVTYGPLRLTVNPNCQGRLAATEEPGQDLHVTVLGNPVGGESVSFEVRGAEGQPLWMSVVSESGRAVSGRSVERAGTIEQQQLSLGNPGTGLLLLRVSTPTQSQTLKLLRAN